MIPAAPLASHDTSKAITADREEKKYLLARHAVRSFLEIVESHLPRHRFEGDGANTLPDPEHYVTTIYFDSASHAQLRAALRDSGHNVKIRAREYYDLHASLAEVATQQADLIYYRPWVWFEIKRKLAGRTQKLRFRLDKHEVPSFFRGDHPAFREGGGQHESELADIVAFVRSLSEPLVPSCIVNYQRIPFQDPRGALRITLDLDVGYYPAPPDLWSRDQALVRGTFGTPAAVERSALIEVKCTSKPPSWLSAALAIHGAMPSGYSKFTHGGCAVHGVR